MNVKQKAAQLEKFLEEEITKNIPIVVLSDKSLVYKQYKIKENKKGLWDLVHVKTGDFIDNFRVKSTALLAAKFYDKNQFNKYSEIKHLDLKCWNNTIDSTVFKYKLETAKDLDRKDLFRCRFELSNSRAKFCKEEISRLFKAHF